jgi:hypothetical protein
VSDSEVIAADLPLGLITTPVAPFGTQAYLAARGSGLAKLKIQTPLGFMLVSEWIDQCAAQFQVGPRYMLMQLEAEQGLIRDKTTYAAGFSIMNLSNQPPMGEPDKKWASPSNWKPPLPPGSPVDSRVVRNGGPKYVADGNWFFVFSGSWKMGACLGAGIPDPKAFPAWDVRKYLGLANQIFNSAKLTRKYLDQFAQAKLSGRIDDITVDTYEGQKVVAADGPTFALLQYNPSLQGLKDRPSIARTLGLA